VKITLNNMGVNRSPAIFLKRPGKKYLVEV
jgi:hypothetical protein